MIACGGLGPQGSRLVIADSTQNTGQYATSISADSLQDDTASCSLKLIAFVGLQLLQIVYSVVASLSDSDYTASSINGIALSSERSALGIIYSCSCIIAIASTCAALGIAIYVYLMNPQHSRITISYANRILVVVYIITTLLRRSSTETMFNFPYEDDPAMSKMSEVYFMLMLHGKIDECQLQSLRIPAKILLHAGIIACFFDRLKAMSYAAITICAAQYVLSDVFAWKIAVDGGGLMRNGRLNRKSSTNEQSTPTPTFLQRRKFNNNEDKETSSNNQNALSDHSTAAVRHKEEWERHVRELPIGIILIKQSREQIAVLNRFAQKLFESRFGKTESASVSDFVLHEIEFAVVPSNPLADKNKLDRQRLTEFSSNVKKQAKVQQEPKKSGQKGESAVISGEASTATKVKSKMSTLSEILMNFETFRAESVSSEASQSNDLDDLASKTATIEVYSKIPCALGKDIVSVIGKISFRKQSSEFIVILDEITKYERLANLADRDEYKNRILNSMSHELHTPLNYSMGCLAVALEDEEISEKIKKTVLKPIMKSQKKGLSIINDILDFQLIITQNILKINFEQIQVSQIVQVIQELFQEDFDSQGISLTFEVTVSPDEVICSDFNRLISIFMNLVNNAMRYTRKGGVTIRIGHYQSSKHLQIEVTDTGRGMDIQHYKQINEKLCNFNITDCLVTDNQHMGFGLTISQIIVNILAIEDQQILQLQQNDGGGCTFTFTIENINYTSETNSTVLSHHHHHHHHHHIQKTANPDFVNQYPICAISQNYQQKNMRRIQTSVTRDLGPLIPKMEVNNNKRKATMYRARQSQTTPIKDVHIVDLNDISQHSNSILPLNHQLTIEQVSIDKKPSFNRRNSIDDDTFTISAVDSRKYFFPHEGDVEGLNDINSDIDINTGEENDSCQKKRAESREKVGGDMNNLNPPTSICHDHSVSDYHTQKRNYIHSISLRNSNIFNAIPGSSQPQNTLLLQQYSRNLEQDFTTPLPSTARDHTSQVQNSSEHLSIISHNENIEKKVNDYDFNSMMRNTRSEQQRELKQTVSKDIGTFRNVIQPNRLSIGEVELTKFEGKSEFAPLFPRQLILQAEGKQRTRESFFRLSSLASQQKEDPKTGSVVATLGQNYIGCACKRILCVDDEIMNISILKVYLTKIGFAQEIAFNGQEAIELFLTMYGDKKKWCKSPYCRIFNAVLLDCNMPTMDGWECSKLMRNLMGKGNLPSVPIIAVTAYVTQQVTELCIENGMDIVLSKPVHIDTIRKTLFSMIPSYEVQ